MENFAVVTKLYMLDVSRVLATPRRWFYTKYNNLIRFMTTSDTGNFRSTQLNFWSETALILIILKGMVKIESFKDSYLPLKETITLKPITTNGILCCLDCLWWFFWYIFAFDIVHDDLTSQIGREDFIWVHVSFVAFSN